MGSIWLFAPFLLLSVGLATTDEVLQHVRLFLAHVKSCPAKVGEKLRTHHFNTGTVSLLHPEMPIQQFACLRGATAESTLNQGASRGLLWSGLSFPLGAGSDQSPGDDPDHLPGIQPTNVARIVLLPFETGLHVRRPLVETGTWSGC
jgi:hypothetical protein